MNMGKRTENIQGHTYGDLTAVEFKCVNKDRLAVWLWQCSCSNTIELPANWVKSKHYRSCGCKQAEKRNAGAKRHIEKDRIEGTRKTSLTARMHKDNKSGVKGVCFVQKRNKWLASIGFKGKVYNLGYYALKEDAIAARLEAEQRFFRPILESKESPSK